MGQKVGYFMCCTKNQTNQNKQNRPENATDRKQG
jgi:hypothetical protein